MKVEKPRFWDYPEGEIIRWIVFGRVYKKDKLKERYLQTIKRRNHGWSLIYNSELGFHNCWNKLEEAKIFWKKPDEDFWVIPEIYNSYWDMYSEKDPILSAVIEEIYFIDEPIIKRAYQLIKRPMIIRAHHYLWGMNLHKFLVEMIGLAKNRILVTSPYIQKTEITEKLVQIKKKKNIPIRFYYKPLNRNQLGYKEQKEATNFLKKNEIHTFPYKKLHAKIVVIDDIIAIVSSYNWTSYTATGDSWDAGIITFDIEVVDEIINSLREIR